MDSSYSQEAAMARVPEYQDKIMDFCRVDQFYEQFYEDNQPCLDKNSFQSKKQCSCPQNICPCEVDIQLKVTDQSPSKALRKAVVIVVAIEKMRRKVKTRPFTDDDLMDIINAVLEPVPFHNYEYTYMTGRIYRFFRANSCNIRDIQQKCFVLSDPAQLVALHLQSPNASHEVRLNMALYRPKNGPSTIKIPVALGIKGKSLYLSCVKSDSHPLLQLEEADILKDIDGDKLGRFIFHKVDVDNHTRFESAAFPGWYICTSQESNKPVSMTNRLGEVSITDYVLI
uniref:Interleukin-1 n=1 Tax=Sphenodon punctatus TaxID=8508 RepID=A0A8D0L1B7_SPHPU